MSVPKHVQRVTLDVLSKGLHRSVQGTLIKRSMTRLLSAALKMGGCVLGGRWLMWVTVVLTHKLKHTETYQRHHIRILKFDSGASFRKYPLRQ